jgi:uroporphyrinogen decarboxylase
MAEMKPRERVMMALDHREPDRIPLDIGGGYSTSISIEGYESLKTHLGIATETKIFNSVFRIAYIDEVVRKHLGCDFYPITVKNPLHWTQPPSEPGTLIDLWGIKWKQVFYSNGCHYYELIYSPLAEADIEDLDKYPWPDPEDPGYTMGLADEVRDLYENTDYALMADSGFKDFWELAYMLRGYEQFLMDLKTNPEFVTSLLEKLLEINVAGTTRFLDTVGRYIQVIRTSDDLATQNGLMMSPETYRTLIKPVYKKFFKLIKSKTDAKIFYHGCGDVRELMNDLIDIGVDIINPVQVSAMGDTAVLKKKYGNKLAFWGAIDTQQVLPRGTEKEVQTEVKRRIHDLGPGGGFVAAAVHNIQADVPPENIVAMVQAVHEFGRYPLDC